MLTCQFYGGRLAEVMQTMASLFFIGQLKKIPINEIVFNALYVGEDFYKTKREYVIIDNLPIFKNIEKCLVYNFNEEVFTKINLQENWVKYYTSKDDFKDKNIMIVKPWIDFIYETYLYKAVFYNKNLWDKIRSSYFNCFINKNTLALHIRRKDFVLIENNREKYQDFNDRKTIPLNMIKQIINDCGSNFKILIFSDDILWCKQNIPSCNEIQFIEGNKPYIDLILMSMCDNIIKTPGSTFSEMAVRLKI